MSREIVNTNGEHDLWERCLRSDGGQWLVPSIRQELMSLAHPTDQNLRSYQHKITGEKSQSPADCVGGILADERG